jgi:hypothetical protein
MMAVTMKGERTRDGEMENRRKKKKRDSQIFHLKWLGKKNTRLFKLRLRLEPGEGEFFLDLSKKKKKILHTCTNPP